MDQPTEASCATGGPGRSRDSSAPRARPPHQAALAPRAPAGSAVRDSAAPTPADEARPRATPRVGRIRTNGLPMSALGGSGRAAPKEEGPGLTHLGNCLGLIIGKISHQVCSILAYPVWCAEQTEKMTYGSNLPFVLATCRDDTPEANRMPRTTRSLYRSRRTPR